MTTYFIQILQGLLVTLGVSLGALLVAAVLGLAGAAAKLSPYRWLNWVGDIYSTVIRGVPDLVWMLLLYFGGQILINDLFEAMGYRSGPQINPFVAGVLTIGFVYGAYMTETFRGAILAIPRGQMEAAWAFGMGRLQTFVRITLPQMVRYALPSFTNNWLVLIKATALISLIGLQEMTYLAKQASAKATALVSLIGLHDMTYLAKQSSAAVREPFAFFLFTAALYLVYTSLSLWALRRLSERYSLGADKVQLL